MIAWIDCTNGLTAAKFLTALQHVLSDTRSPDEVRRLITSDSPRLRAQAVFDVLATAEAQVHGTLPDKVHFHEVGSLDNIMRVWGVFAAFDLLGITCWYASPPVVGNGTVACSHGTLSVPVPATACLIEKYRIPVAPVPGGHTVGELTTPTGIALLTQAKGFMAKPPDNALVLRTEILPTPDR